MSDRSDGVMRLLARLKEERLAAGIEAQDLDAELILGPGWIERFESGATVPDLETIFVLIDRIGADPVALFSELRNEASETSAAELNRLIRGEQDGDDLIIHFEYAKFDAKYRLEGATIEELERVLSVLRDGLAGLADEVITAPTRSGVENAIKGQVERQIKTNAVASAFMKAVELWPRANPSDLWWFVVYRAYCDPYNHPAKDARLSFAQSWKRTGGWALEEILVRHYGPTLKQHDVTIEIAQGSRKDDLLAQLDIGRRLIADKVDVVLTGPGDVVFGVVHVKASFAERRTDDVPMSEALVQKGYFSPLWTMDCKSMPSETPHNRGELGVAEPSAARSQKRVGIEDDAEFTACFSYNRNTRPTVNSPDPKAGQVILCDFNDPADAFAEAVLAGWEQFRSGSK